MTSLQSTRKSANIFVQIWLNFYRAGRSVYMQPLDLILQSITALIGGVCVGLAISSSNTPIGILNPREQAPTLPIALNVAASQAIVLTTFFILVALALVSAPPAVQVFGAEKSVYFREASVGHNRLAYFIGKDVFSSVRITLDALHFCVGVFFSPIPLDLNSGYAIFWVGMYCTYSVGYIVAQLVPLRSASLTAVIVSLILTIFNGFVQNIPESARTWCYTYWISSATYFTATSSQRDLFAVNSIAKSIGYPVDLSLAHELGYAFIFGLAGRLVSLIFMLVLNRDQMK